MPLTPEGLIFLCLKPGVLNLFRSVQHSSFVIALWAAGL